MPKKLYVICLSFMFLETCFTIVPKAPHIVFMIADDLGWNDVSFHGSKQIPTPNIDALAKDGIILNNYYVQPTCSPSRASLMTGKYPIRLGFQHDVIKTSEPWGLPLDEKILPEYLKSLNYKTHGVGKWHLGFFKEEYLPMARGFDSFFGFWTGVEDYFTHFANAGNFSGLDLHDDFRNVWSYNGTYGTELFATKAKEVIMKHDQTQPLFLYIGQQAPHSGNFKDPLQVPESYVEPLEGIDDPERRTFAGMVSALDHAVGDLFDALEKSKMLENTILIFTTDNGGAVEGNDGTFGSNWPLRGSKYNLWEGGIRGTAFMWSPFLRNRSRICNEIMHITDWLPTLLTAAGGGEASKALKNLDGVDQWRSLVQNLPSRRQDILLNIDPIEDVEGLRWKNFKLVKGSYYNEDYNGWYNSEGRVIKTFPPAVPHTNELQRLYKKNYIKYMRQSKVSRILRRKYAKDPRLASRCVTPGCRSFPIAACGPMPSSAADSCKPKKDYCLFDIYNDPCEYFNIAQQFPEITKRMLEKIDKYRPYVKEAGGKPSDPMANPELHGNAWMPWK